jgi:cytidylate kinase
MTMPTLGSSRPLRPAVARLVDRQMATGEQARYRRPATGGDVRPRAPDFVCLSRAVGLEETPVPAGLADRLHWPLLDRQVLDAMAGDDGCRRRIYDSMDERDLNWWEEALRPLLEQEFARNDYFRCLCETLLSLARQGPAVFVGRGADLLLPRDQGLRVRLTAPAETRMERYARAHELTAAEARNRIQRLQVERNRFFRRHFGVDEDEPRRWDLTLNLDRLDPEAAIDVVLATRQAVRERLQAAARAPL